MAVYDVAAASATSNAITVATLTFGQAQLMLTDATALQDDILAIAAVAVCGNGVCELGERPNSTAAAVNATGTDALPETAGRCCTTCQQGWPAHATAVFAAATKALKVAA